MALSAVTQKALIFSCPVEGTPYEGTRVLATARAKRWHLDGDGSVVDEWGPIEPVDDPTENAP